MPAAPDVRCRHNFAKPRTDFSLWEIRNSTAWHFNRLSPNLQRDWARLKTTTSSSPSDVTSHFQADCYICCWLLPIITHQNNTTLLGTKIKAAVHVCATQLSIKTPLHTDTCDLKETVKNVMNPSRQMRRQYAALQYHNALEIRTTTDTTGRSYEARFHFFRPLLCCLFSSLAPSLFNHRGNSSFQWPEDTRSHLKRRHKYRRCCPGQCIVGVCTISTCSNVKFSTVKRENNPKMTEE